MDITLTHNTQRSKPMSADDNTANNIPKPKQRRIKTSKITMQGKEYLRDSELARATGLTTSWLRELRQHPRHKSSSPPYYKIGGRIYYNLDEVREWINNCKHGGTKI